METPNEAGMGIKCKVGLFLDPINDVGNNNWHNLPRMLTLYLDNIFHSTTRINLNSSFLEINNVCIYL